MPAQSSLKARAVAILERTTQRTVSAQSQKDAAQYPQIAQKTSNSQYSDIEKIRTWLNRIGEPEEDHDIVLDKCRRNPEALTYYLEQATEYEREKQLQNIFNLLAENPARKHVFVTDTTVDPDNVVLAFAIHGVATFDMLIPKNTYDSFVLQEMIEIGSKK